VVCWYLNDTPRHGRATRPGRERCLVVGGKLDLMESLRGLGRGSGPPVPWPVASGYLWFLRRAVGTLFREGGPGPL
jgi:hypothetical protein